MRMKTIKKSNFQTGLISPRLGRIKTLAAAAICALSVWSLHATQPVVAIHDSELTRALEFMPAADGTPDRFRDHQ
jgi:hypothetical protein